MADTIAPVEDRPYQMIVGGIILLKDGKFAAVASSAAVYGNMSYKHVQAFWGYALNNPSLVTASEEFAKKAQTELLAFGNAAGVAQGRMTEKELTELVALQAKLSGGKK